MGEVTVLGSFCWGHWKRKTDGKGSLRDHGWMEDAGGSVLWWCGVFVNATRTCGAKHAQCAPPQVPKDTRDLPPSRFRY